MLAIGEVETEGSAGARGKGAIFWEGISSPDETGTWFVSKAETVEVTRPGGNLELETGLRVAGIENAAAGETGEATAEDRGAMPGGGMTEAARPGEERGSRKAARVPGTVTGAGASKGTVEGAG